MHVISFGPNSLQPRGPTNFNLFPGDRDWWKVNWSWSQMSSTHMICLRFLIKQINTLITSERNGGLGRTKNTRELLKLLVDCIGLYFIIFGSKWRNISCIGEENEDRISSSGTRNCIQIVRAPVILNFGSSHWPGPARLRFSMHKNGPASHGKSMQVSLPSAMP